MIRVYKNRTGLFLTGQYFPCRRYSAILVQQEGDVLHPLHPKHQAGASARIGITDIRIHISKHLHISFLARGKNGHGCFNKLVQRTGAIPLQQQRHGLRVCHTRRYAFLIFYQPLVQKSKQSQVPPRTRMNKYRKLFCIFFWNIHFW